MQPIENDFAFGIKLDLQAHQLYEFSVPVSIYQYVQTHDLRDVRIFDEQGTIIPINVTAPLRQTNKQEKTSEETLPLNFFPVEDDPQAPVQDLNVYVQRNDAGTIVNINSTTPSTASTTPYYYIVDLMQNNRQTPGELIVDWDAESAAKAHFIVDTSDDLNKWQRAGAGAVFNLQNNGQRLLQNKIRIKAVKRYLKISAGDKKTPILTGLQGIARTTTRINEDPLSAQAHLLRNDSNNFFYQIPGKFTLSSLSIIPQADNAIYTVVVNSGETEGKLEKVNYQGTIFKLALGEEVSTNEAIQVNYPNDRYWKVEVRQSNQAELAAPAFSFNYYPHRIRLLSNQAGSYTVAFGNATLKEFGPRIPGQIKQNNDKIATVSLSKPISLGGVEKLKPPSPPKDYSKVILWSVLILVLVVMGIMVLRLAKHMKAS